MPTKSFLDLQLRTKLILLVSAVLAVFVAVLWNAYGTMNGLLRRQEDVQIRQADAVAFARMDSNRNESRVLVLTLLAGDLDSASRTKLADRVRELTTENVEMRRQMFDRNHENEWLRERLQRYQSLAEVYNRTRDQVVQTALAGRVQEARQVSLGEQDQRFTELRQMGDEMFKHVQAEANQAVQESHAATQSAKRFYLLLGLGLVTAGLSAIWGVGRLVSTPLRELVEAAQRIARGDLRANISATNRADEIGELARAFQTMVENLRTMQRDVQEGVNVLASSASEIFTATAQIAAGATETATAVSQTTSTAEEVKQTAQVSAQKAGNVADIAQRAAQSAQTGRKAIEESIAGMQHIREQMELIAETVVRLSEQSQAIGEITSSVNDLAEQSNLLAVNASIEAAKAGEHGRGFAVVAHEIRNLANESKASTAQIRTILNDIQRATTATVMAAEQGSKAVDTGVKQVNQSGDAIRALAESIVAAAQAATQITASTQEQLVGIDQVTIAIQNILQASKQNATATQQAEAGAKTLNQLGQNLKSITQRFTV